MFDFLWGSSPLVRPLFLGLVILVVPPAGKRDPADMPAAPAATSAAPAATSAAPAANPATLSKKRLRRAQPPRPKPYQVGKATWYGDRFHGRVTASGEQYDMFQLTAAHLKLPLGTRVCVTRLSTGRSVVVRITDRGPNHPLAVIDLSYAAAKEIGLVEHGTTAVRLDLTRNSAPTGGETALLAAREATR